MYVYGRGGGWGRGRTGGRGAGRGAWPGNGPFSHLPPWERPGWLYGPGSCWAMGYWDGVSPSAATPPTGTIAGPENVESLRQQKEFLENQIKSLQDSIERISKRLDDITEQ